MAFASSVVQSMSVMVNSGMNPMQRIQATLDRVMKEATSLQDISSTSLHDLDGEIEEVKEEVEVKATALEVLKQRVKGEINEFREEIQKQVKELGDEYAAKIRDMNALIAERERQWEMWKSEARSSRDVFSKGMTDNEKNVLLYENRVRELRAKREAIAISMRAKIRQLNTMLDEDFRRETQTHQQMEIDFLGRLTQMKDQADADFLEADTKWAENSDQIDKLVLRIAEALFKKQNRGV